MDAIEKAIRSAFEKGDVDDRTFREKVYRSAFAALDRALQANPHLAPEIVEKRRNDLQAKIIEIETEFIPAVPAVEPPVTKPVQPHPDSDWSFIAPTVEPEGPRTTAPRAAPAVDPVAAAMSRASDPIVPIPEQAEPRALKPDAGAVREIDVRQPVSERTEPRAGDIRPVPSLDAAADSSSPERIEPRAPELQPAPLRDAAVRGPVLERIDPLVSEVQPAPLRDATARRRAPERIEPRAPEVLSATSRGGTAAGSMPERMEPPASEVRATPPRDAGTRRPSAERIEPRMAEIPAPASPAANGGRPQPSAEPRAPEVSAAAARETRRPVPEVFFPDASDFESSPSAEPEVASDEISAVGGPNVATERRRPFAAIFLGVTLLALAAIGTWWGISTGLIKIPGPSDTDEITQVPPDDENFTPGEEEGPGKPGQADAGRNWTLVFSPSDPTTVNAPGDTKADVMKDDTGGFARIRSSASGSAVVFDVPKGVLEQISGKHAVFDIVARAEEGKETQFSVDCNFGELGDCGRKRYRASYQKADFLFEMDMPGKAPGSDGTIAINSDIDNGGKSVDVYEIKVSVSE